MNAAERDTLTYSPHFSFKALIENLPQKIVLKDNNSVYLLCNEIFASDFGLDASVMTGKTDYDFFPRELADKSRKDDIRIMNSGKAEEFEETCLINGQSVSVHAMKTPIKDTDGKITGILGIFWDIAERKNLEKEIEGQRQNLEQLIRERTEELHKRYKQLQHETAQRKNFEDLFTTVFTNSTIGMYLAQQGKFLLCSPEFLRIVGYENAELINQPTIDLVLHGDRPTVKEKAIAMLKGYNNTPYEFRITSKDGQIIWIMEKVISVTYQGTRTILSNFMDITQRKNLEQKLVQMATHDSLTGLPCRILLEDRLIHALKQSERHGTMTAVAMLDLDKFKSINDTFGHDVGDKLLKTVADRLTAVLRKVDTVARLGGDEFVIVLSDISSDKQVAATADRIVTAIREQMEIDGHTIQITTSIGIAMYPKNGSDPEALLKLADIAMYHAKETGRNSYRFFEE